MMSNRFSEDDFRNMSNAELGNFLRKSKRKQFNKLELDCLEDERTRREIKIGREARELLQHAEKLYAKHTKRKSGLVK